MMDALSLPPLAVIQDDRAGEHWSLVVPLGMALTIVDCEVMSELVVQTVYAVDACRS